VAPAVLKPLTIKPLEIIKENLPQPGAKLIPPQTKIPTIPVMVRAIPIIFHDPTKLMNNLKINHPELIPKLPEDETYKIILHNGLVYHKFTTADTYVTPEDPMMEYHSRQSVKKNVVAWGQRKLGLALIQFLSKYLSETSVINPIVIYAGAAPGENIAFVAKFFKNVIFHLYDPRDYMIDINDPSVYLYQNNEGIKPQHRIILHTGEQHGWFTDEIANYWKNYQATIGGVYFISDIRSTNHAVENSQQFEEGVWRDMVAQANWVKIIKPVRSQLKFRLPYDLGVNSSIKQMFPTMKIPYLPGIIYKGIYNKPTSTESRLVTPNHKDSDYEDVLYDFKEYESKMFYFNTEVKEKFQFINILDNSFNPVYPDELLNDYNSMAETFIWVELMKYLNIPVNLNNVKKLCDNFTKAIALDKGKSLSKLRKS
jgi:hypothetical protein